MAKTARGIRVLGCQRRRVGEHHILPSIPVKSPRPTNRRQFVKTLGAAAIAAPFFTRHLISAPPSATLRHASFGVAGMAWNDIQALTSNPFLKLVAVAEVDLNRIEQVKSWYPEAKIYQDWRELLDKPGHGS